MFETSLNKAFATSISHNPRNSVSLCDGHDNLVFGKTGVCSGERANTR